MGALLLAPLGACERAPSKPPKLPASYVRIAKLSPDATRPLKVGDKVNLQVQLDYALTKADTGAVMVVVQTADNQNLVQRRRRSKGVGKATLAVDFVVPQTSAVKVFTPLSEQGRPRPRRSRFARTRSWKNELCPRLRPARERAAAGPGRRARRSSSSIRTTRNEAWCSRRAAASARRPSPSCATAPALASSPSTFRLTPSAPRGARCNRPMSSSSRPTCISFLSRARSFDHVFVCFLLEHLARPLEALEKLKQVLKPGGSITVIEGDHGSTYFHPDSAAAHEAIRCQVELQRASGGNANIGRELYPLLRQALCRCERLTTHGVRGRGRPRLVDGTSQTFTAMIEGVREGAVRAAMISAARFDEGIRALYRTAEDDGVFCHVLQSLGPEIIAMMAAVEPPYEVERRAEHAARPGFRITELQISKTQKVPWHYHTNVRDTFYVLQETADFSAGPEGRGAPKAR